MTVGPEEKEFIGKVVKRYRGCAVQQKEADRKLRLALSKAFNSDVLAETAMRVVRECRG